jgi:hypothetical protein
MDMMLDGHQAVVIGMAGLDYEHGAQSELHPVFLLAVREGQPGTYGYFNTLDPSNDHWAIFARNYGDEGMCSSQELHLTDQNLTVVLPPPPGMTSAAQPSVVGGYFNTTYSLPGSSPQVTWWPGGSQFGGMPVTFHFQAQSSSSGQPWNSDFAFGEVDVNWTSSGSPTSHFSLSAGQARSVAASTKPGEDLIKGSEPQAPEAQLADWLREMDSSEQRMYFALLPRLDRKGTPTRSHHVPVVRSDLPPGRPAVAAPVAVTYNAQRIQNIVSRVLAICIATKARLPGLAQACPAVNYNARLPTVAPAVDSLPGAPPGIVDKPLPIFNRWPPFRQPAGRAIWEYVVFGLVVIVGIFVLRGMWKWVTD